MTTPTREDALASIIIETGRIQHAAADALRTHPSRSDHTVRTVLAMCREELAVLEAQFAATDRSPGETPFRSATLGPFDVLSPKIDGTWVEFRKDCESSPVLTIVVKDRQARVMSTSSPPTRGQIRPHADAWARCMAFMQANDITG